MTHSKARRFISAIRSPSARVIALCTVVMTLSTLPAFLTGALAVQLSDSLRFDIAALGLVITIFYLSSAAFSARIGKLVQKRGASVGMRIALMGTATSLLSVGIFARSWGWLAVSVIVGGVTNTAARTSTTLLLVEKVDPSRQGLAFGLRQSSPALGMLAGGLGLPLIALTLGWRWVYIGFGAIALFLQLAIPRTQSRDEVVAQRAARPDASLLPMMLLFLTIGFGAAGVNVLGAFFVQYSVHEGIAPGAAGFMLATVNLMSLFVTVGVGVASDVRFKGKLLGVIGILLICAAGTFLLGVGEEWLIPIGALLALGIGQSWTGLFALAVTTVNPNAPATATGFTHTGAYIGAAGGPFLFGAVVAADSYRSAWWLMAVVLSAGALFAYLSRVTIRREVAVRAQPEEG